MDFMLREWQLTDAPSVAIYANNMKIALNLRDAFPFPYTLDHAMQFIQSCMGNEGMGQMTRAIVADGHAVGSIGVFVQQDVNRKSAEVGYWLAEPYWGNGIMPQAVRQICKEAFRAFSLERIYAEVFAPNRASARVLEKAGFILEGVLRNSVYKNGCVLNARLFSVLKDEL